MFPKPSLLENAIGWFLMAGPWILLTAWCGGALVVQNQELRSQAFAADEACHLEAEAVRTDGAEAQHEAYQVCMDDGTVTRPEGVTDPMPAHG